MYLSDKTPALRKLLKAMLAERQAQGVQNSSETIFFTELVDFIEEISKSLDLLTVKTQEIEEYSESMSMDLHDIQEIVIKNLNLEENDIDDDYNYMQERLENEFVTLQCPFCEELFFIESDEFGDIVECPFCNKNVDSKENKVKH